MEIQYLPIDWLTYHDFGRKLAAAILSSSSKIDEIVAISRGGLSLGHILSDFLQIPIYTFTIQSFTDIQKQGQISITEPLKSPIKGKCIILVDDVADSGKTIKRALSYLKSFKPKKIITVTMFFKPHSVYRPDFYAKEIPNEQWIIFPSEITETVISITKSMEKDDKSKADIQKKLMSLGYTNNQIEFVRKYYLSS